MLATGWPQASQKKLHSHFFFFPFVQLWLDSDEQWSIMDVRWWKNVCFSMLWLNSSLFILKYTPTFHSMRLCAHERKIQQIPKLVPLSARKHVCISTLNFYLVAHSYCMWWVLASESKLECIQKLAQSWYHYRLIMLPWPRTIWSKRNNLRLAILIVVSYEGASFS